MGKRLLAIAAVLFPLMCSAGVELLPSDVRLDATVPSPEQFLGFEQGDWHVRHDQVVAYMRLLAEQSPRVSVQQYGLTWEKRPLLLVMISSPDNLANLEQIRTDHLAGKGSKLVVWQGFSVHGNEASGTHASLSYAHYLAASQDSEVEEALNDTVVMLDPSINPDGFDRFVNWVNANKGHNPVADRATREHQEFWPNGRTNHYWFDLNRDWLLLTHPESRARIAQYQAWRPHVLTDHHEMGSDSTYFFQPGAPERKHPLTPAGNVELTQALAEFHARALDSVGELYFTREQFDDFYYGKGSTYPDVQGTIGILFEQASARGHLMSTVNGPLTFRRAIRNQLRTAISTLQGARANAQALLDYRVAFDRESARLADRDPVKAFVFGGDHDVHKARALADILSQHGIEVYELAAELTVEGQQFNPGSAFVVPTAQRQYRLIQAVMETRTSFDDTVFYDVSTWTLPLAFDLPYASLKRADKAMGDQFARSWQPALKAQPNAYAYAISWAEYPAPAVLQSLQKDGVVVRAATQPLMLSSGESLPRGTLVVARGLNLEKGSELADVVEAAAEPHGVNVYSIETGLNWQGRDLGSATFRTLKPIKPALLVEGPVQGYDAGEVWHLLDQRVGMPLTMLPYRQLTQTDLSRYTHLVLVDGNYEFLSDDVAGVIANWVKRGGTLISTRRASSWVTNRGLHLAEPAADDATDSAASADQEVPASQALTVAPYGDHQQDFSLQIIGGAILRGELDVTHPLGFGYVDSDIAVFRQGRALLEPSENPYQTPLRYTENPRISGYIAADRIKELAGTAAVVVDMVGQGRVIRFADNPNFRGFWYGTNRLFLNALYFSQIIDKTPTEIASP